MFSRFFNINAVDVNWTSRVWSQTNKRKADENRINPIIYDRLTLPNVHVDIKFQNRSLVDEVVAQPPANQRAGCIESMV